ncbi:MAG: glycosyltransferase family 9 protein, partial [Lentisphaerae bacterium]|nr:glycosyltransferase family 9 protein [Lentisphaerota bacterium]
MAPASQSRAAARILILRGGALGDFILTLPLLQALRARRPQAELTLVARARYAALAQVAGLAQNILDIEAARFRAYYAPAQGWASAEKDFLRSFDAVISLLPDASGAARAALESITRGQVVSLAPLPRAGHASDHYLSALRPLGIKPWPAPARSRLDLPPARQAAGRRRLLALGLRAPVLAIHPGSGSASKNWPLSSFLALAQKIRPCWQPLWVTGEAEREWAHLISDRAPRLAETPLLELAAVLSQCQGYLGNDSGITHLAAALGVPTLALFEPT